MDIQEIIRSLVPGQTFVDLGGLWGTVNERVSTAVLAGAASATMIDEQIAGNELWQKFDSHCAALNVFGYASVQANLDDPELLRHVGTFDVVHCSGVIYHCPNPYHSLRQLRQITKKHLLLGSMTVPDRITNAAGSLDFTEGRMIALPALKGRARGVMKQHFDDLGIVVHNINSPESYDWITADGSANYAPWWWLFTVDTLAAMAQAVGLHVVDSFESWQGFAHYIRFEVRD